MIKCALQFQRKSNQHCPNLYFTILFTNQIKCWFLMRGEKRTTQGKTSHGRVGVENQQTQSTYDTGCGNQTGATLVEGKCSHHQANVATYSIYCLSHVRLCLFICKFVKEGVITSTESFKRRALILSRPNALLVFKSLMDLETNSSLIG